ncbi:hypothetical protein EGW08_001397 [Elysia chlorotica]|uniref:SOCS box domain-containing protein n=1 Tax=Elysia chlorotica TaxID=188477 RepID=A0A433UAN7_ELYCH|nr:hypothetical protein EGW08_001397 [Elysia chlorotica]
MHVHFEQNTCTRTDSDFLSLSWMGKVPEDLPEEGGGWKLDRSQYYVEGWLASGNARGVVGVTFSTSHCHGYDAPPRSNFNLRGHRSEVVLVRWNEPYQKLATCDSLGVIFVWIKHEGRWSIELINDRNSQVTDFAWSHDGRMALICYRDGFILVGSVAGQRYWSSMLNLESTCITCGLWSPDDSQVMFGTMDGKLIVMSAAGAVISQVAVHEGFEITSLAWSCDRFNMEEAEAGKNGGPDYNSHARGETAPGKSHVLAVCFKYGDIFLMSGYDDICPVMVYTTLTGKPRVNAVSVCVCVQGKPLTALTWGHNDKRLFAAAGRHLYVAWVSTQVAPLHFLCQRVLHRAVRSERAVERLPLPQRLRCGVKALFSPTIKSYIPDPLRLREFVCSPPPGGERLFCTMIRHGEETSGGHYTLYLEYLGGLVPLLKGKRASKLRPDFVIFDPKIKSSSSNGKRDQQGKGDGGAAIESDTSSESDSEVYMDGCGSPRMQRRRRPKTFRAEKVNRSITFRTLDELMYDDNLPETNRLVEVTSNIWATKFQMTGASSSLPSCLGQVVYKTSLLRLQPRQMTVSIAEVLPARRTLSRDPNFSPAPVSDDEDSSLGASDGDLGGERKTVEVTVHDASANYNLFCSFCLRGSVVDSPLLENGAVAVNGVDMAITNAAPIACVGGGGVGVVAGKLGGSGTVRSRSLSPVRNSLTQTVPAFKQDGIGASDGMPGDVLLAATNGGGGGWQGARPKANKYTSSNSGSNNSSSNIILSPVLSSRDSHGSSSVNNGSRRTGGNASSSKLNGSPSANSSSVTDSHSSPRSGHTVCAKSNNGKCSDPPSTLPDHPASSQYAISSCSPSLNSSVCGSSQPETVSAYNSLMSSKQKPALLELRQGRAHSDRACFKGGLDLVSVGATPTQLGDHDPTACSSISNSNNGQHPEHSIQLSRWADPAAEAVHLLLEDPTTCVSGQSPREECSVKSPQTQHPLSLQSTLVADCSPTAPYKSDIHRRLYLAQHSFLPDSGAPISPSGCPSCLPSNLCYKDETPSSQCSDPNNVRASVLSNGTMTQLPDSVRQNNLKNSSPPHTGHQLRRSAPTDTGSSWINSLMNPHAMSDTSSALSLARQGSLQRQQELQTSEHLCQKVLSETSEKLKHSDSGPASTCTSSTPTCLLSVLSNPVFVSNHARDSDVSPASDRSLVTQTPGCWISQPALHHGDGTTPPSSPSCPPCNSSSLDKLALILSEDPAAQISSHNFQSMPGFVMRNPDLPVIDSSSSNSNFQDQSQNPLHHDGVDAADCNSFMSPPPSPLAVGPGGNHLGSDLDIQIQATSASLPSSPVRFGRRSQYSGDITAASDDMLKGRCKHLSPLLGRKGLPASRSRLSSQSQSQDLLGLEELRLGQHYESLEMFQKAQLRQKMRRRINSANGRMEQARMFTMHNKAPLWNETSQVYQLDFGGRVTQESAKNFQIELKGKQVMQFGRIDNHAYTLDFQYPFTAVQAFAVALANVTQRLK